MLVKLKILNMKLDKIEKILKKKKDNTLKLSY